MRKERVVVAMSGGVDSSVAAALLKEQGYDAIGMTMCFGLSETQGKKPACCGMQAIEDARRVAHKLGIKHYVVNMHKDLEKHVISDFIKEYSLGRTPNPCVICNEHLKFGVLLNKALSLGAKYLATGHYACIDQRPKTKDHRPQYLLKKAKDKKKDQSYFLYRLKQKQLKHILFPLGNYTKEEVRGLAREFGLAIADKAGSQEICFIPDADYRRFIKTQIIADIKPGPIADKQGNILGEHRGIAFYTIGQREGLGIAAGYPLYIQKIDVKNNRIIVGKKEDILGRECLIKSLNFISKPIKKKIALRVRIRYNHQEAPASLILEKNKARIKFKKPQFAITPGQSAVFYQKDTVIGGGIIDKIIK